MARRKKGKSSSGVPLTPAPRTPALISRGLMVFAIGAVAAPACGEDDDDETGQTMPPQPAPTTAPTAPAPTVALLPDASPTPDGSIAPQPAPTTSTAPTAPAPTIAPQPAPTAPAPTAPVPTAPAPTALPYDAAIPPQPAPTAPAPQPAPTALPPGQDLSPYSLLTTPPRGSALTRKRRPS